MGLSALALLLPEAHQAHGGAQLQRLRLLTAGDSEGLLETGFRLGDVWTRELEQQGPLEPIHLGLPPPLLGRGHERAGFSQDGQRFCRKVGFWRSNRKTRFWKINSLRA